MPVIMKDNVQYAYTTKGTVFHTLSNAEYEALPESEKMNGDVYCIPNREPILNPDEVWAKIGTETLDIGDDLTDGVNQLNSRLTTKELTASDLISAGVFTVGTCYGYLSGNVITLVLLLRAASVATTSTSVLATIKNGYRPKNTLYIMVQDNNNKNAYIKIASDGKLTADVPYTASNNGLIIMTTTYVI